MAEFDQFGSDYRQRLERSISGLCSVDSALKSKFQILEKLVREIDGLDQQPVLDFGCGAGLLTGLLKKLSPNAFGADVSLVSLQHTERCTGCLVQFDGHQLPMRDNSFGMVVASCVFHHILPGERPHIVREISRVLKPGGRLIIIEHNPFNPVTRFVVNRCEFDEDAVLLSLAETRRLLGAEGLLADRDAYFYAVPPVRPWLARIDSSLGRLPIGAQYYCAYSKHGQSESGSPRETIN